MDSNRLLLLLERKLTVSSVKHVTARLKLGHEMATTKFDANP